MVGHFLRIFLFLFFVKRTPQRFICCYLSFALVFGIWGVHLKSGNGGSFPAHFFFFFFVKRTPQRLIFCYLSLALVFSIRGVNLKRGDGGWVIFLWRKKIKMNHQKIIFLLSIISIWCVHQEERGAILHHFSLAHNSLWKQKQLFELFSPPIPLAYP